MRISTSPSPSATARLATSRALDASWRSDEIKSALPPAARISATVFWPRSALRPTDYDVDTKRGELIGYRPADTACAACDHCGGWIFTHLRFLGSFSSTHPKTRAQEINPSSSF